MKRLLVVLAVLVSSVVVCVASMAASGTAAPKPPPSARAVYVVSTTAGDVVKIDPVTLQVTDRIHLGVAYLSSIAIAGDQMYYWSSDGVSPWGTIGRYNLSTNQNEPAYINQLFYAALLRTSPKQPGVLFVGESALSPADIQKWSVPTKGNKRPSLLARTEHGPMGSNLGDFQISDDGSKIWSACGYPYDFLELSTSDLRLTGRVFPAEPYPNSVDSVAVGGTEYLLGGTNSIYGLSIHLYNTSSPATGVHYGAGGTTAEVGSVALSPDATKIYRLVTDQSGENGVVETLSAASGGVLATTPVPISDYFVEGIHVDPVSGRVFLSLDNAIGVLDPSGALVQTIANVPGAGQVLIT